MSEADVVGDTAVVKSEDNKPSSPSTVGATTAFKDGDGLAMTAQGTFGKDKNKTITVAATGLWAGMFLSIAGMVAVGGYLDAARQLVPMMLLAGMFAACATAIGARAWLGFVLKQNETLEQRLVDAAAVKSRLEEQLLRARVSSERSNVEKKLLQKQSQAQQSAGNINETPSQPKKQKKKKASK